MKAEDRVRAAIIAHQSTINRISQLNDELEAACAAKDTTRDELIDVVKAIGFVGRWFAVGQWQYAVLDDDSGKQDALTLHITPFDVTILQ